MKKNIFIFFAVVLMVTGCGKKGSDNPNPGGGTTTIPSPTAVSLTAPAQNALCTTGAVISNTQSSIAFTWDAASNSDSYDLTIKNLLTNTTSTQNTSATTLAVTLSRNTPYSWYIVSKSSKTSNTAQSPTWKFYNAGLGTVSYAPFPATITAPAFGQNITATAGLVNLTWTGSDVDNDIVSYDVYFGTTNMPALLKSGIATMFYNGVPVSSGATYYWKVITTDSQGNTSDSGVFQFSVN